MPTGSRRNAPTAPYAAGSGLIVITALAGVKGTAAVALLLAGLALVGLGLSCVWLELGRLLRALHVFFNPRVSWMTREAIAATVLFPVGIAAAAGVYGGMTGLVWLPAALALVFVYCQGRMLNAAKGIRAWREPLMLPLVLATSLAEGAGLFFLALPWHGQGGALSSCCSACCYSRGRRSGLPIGSASPDSWQHARTARSTVHHAVQQWDGGLEPA